MLPPDRVKVFEDYEVKGKFILGRIPDRSLPLVVEEWYLFGGCFYRFKVYRYGSAIRDEEGVRYEISYHFHVVERLGSKVKIQVFSLSWFSTWWVGVVALF